MKGISCQKPQGSVEDKQKIKEVMNQLEDNYTLELLHQLEIRSLKDKIIQMHKSIEMGAPGPAQMYGNSSLPNIPPGRSFGANQAKEGGSPYKGFDQQHANHSESGIDHAVDKHVASSDYGDHPINEVKEVKEVRVESRKSQREISDK
jgi:hypothetical protein